MKNHASANDASRTGVHRLVGTAVLTALVVVLQLLGSSIRIGAYPLSLVLVPIVIGAAVYGAGTGAFLGFVFSAVVAVATITGVDQNAFMLWTANPALTLFVIFAKGTLAGWLSGLVYGALRKKNVYGGAVAAAAVCPTVNTGIFCLVLLFGFRDILSQWAGGSNLVMYTFLTLAGLNYLIELGVNMLLSPVIVRILKAVRLA